MFDYNLKKLTIAGYIIRLTLDDALSFLCEE